MVKYKKTKITLGLIALFILIRIVFFPSLLSYTGYMEVTEKPTSLNRYYIETDIIDRALNVQMRGTDSFKLNESPDDSRQVNLVDVWDDIEVKERYFVTIDLRGIIVPRYKLRILDTY